MNRNQRNKILVKFSARNVSVYVACAPAVKLVTRVLSRVVSHAFLCLVLVELKAQCYRAYVCVRNTCCSCNMS